MQFPDLSTLFLFGVPMMPLIFGVVEFIKKTGLSGPALTWTSFGLGLLGGVLYQLTEVNICGANVSCWISAVIFGGMVGLAVSGVYDFVSARFPKKDDEVPF